ncbi:apolipoprotein L6-like [Pempheris klunzingeri]|uniref:apolipoprotein L6-like n=1 Tax=Pempheris klunzingeri TaxID=3127111 RepID=UPI00397FCBEC
MSRPVPLPRTKVFYPDKFEEDEPIKCISTPKSPTKPPEGSSVRSAPPPVAPKKWTVKKSPGGADSVNGTLQIVMVVDKPLVNNDCEAQPPPLPPKTPKKQTDSKNKILDADSLLDWWKGATPWSSLCSDHKNGGDAEKKIIKVKAKQLYKAVQVYIVLLSKHGDFLTEHTAELLCVADNLDKVSKGTMIAGITGGATTVVGGIAAAAGVILSPLTLGASLALTVVGAGVATAGGLTGASAAIANKVNSTQDKKKIEKTFKEYEDHITKILDCLKFINEGMEQLKQHDLSVLSEARKDSVSVARAIQLAATGGGSARAIEANSKASGLMQGLAIGMDMHFTQGKDGPKLKKGHESKLAKKIRRLAEELNEGLNELMQIRLLFCEHFSFK